MSVRIGGPGRGPAAITARILATLAGVGCGRGHINRERAVVAGQRDHPPDRLPDLSAG